MVAWKSSRKGWNAGMRQTITQRNNDSRQQQPYVGTTIKKKQQQQRQKNKAIMVMIRWCFCKILTIETSLPISSTNHRWQSFHAAKEQSMLQSYQPVKSQQTTEPFFNTIHIAHTFHTNFLNAIITANEHSIIPLAAERYQQPQQILNWVTNILPTLTPSNKVPNSEDQARQGKANKDHQ